MAGLEGCCPGAALSSQGLGRSGGLLQELAIGQLQNGGGFSWTLAQAKGRSGAMRRNALSVPPWIDPAPQEAFCFLPRPDIIDFKKLTKSNAVYNLQQAFNTAEQQLGLAKLLDPEGKALNWPWKAHPGFPCPRLWRKESPAWPWEVGGSSEPGKILGNCSWGGGLCGWRLEIQSSARPSFP